ncbi:MAG: DUF2157 domain-containing protein [Proteobacteria bacterium]|nr:MAG: DUF2157 domain-containing protein [Pseudomonadota bacterium]
MSRFAVYHWIKNKAIKPAAIEQALMVAGERSQPQSWPPFIRKLLWLLGCLALLAGLLFFMAYNWQAMGPMFKFALLQGSLLLAVVLYWLWSKVLAPRYQLSQQTIEFGQAIGRVSVAVLIGGLLALFGQVYQTGADPWQLFALWSLLISLMVVSSGQAVMWLMWSVLINVALALYVHTKPVWLLLLGHSEHAVWLFLLVNGILWLLLSLLNGEHKPSLKYFKRYRVSQAWALQLQAMAIMAFLTYMGMAAAIDWQDYGLSFALTSLVGLAGLYGYYRHVRLDLAMLALWSLSMMTLIMTVIMKLIDDWASGFTLFWLSIIIIIMTTVSVKWLNALRQQNIKLSVPEIEKI